MNNKKRKVIAVAMTTLLCATTIQPIMAQESTIPTLQQAPEQQGTSEKEVSPDIEVTPTDNSLLRDSVPTETNVEDVEINETNFPDAEFLVYLKGLPEGGDGKFTSDEIAKITRIGIEGYTPIKDLKGIEHFTALIMLNCSNTGITSLDVSKNTALTTLDCSNTPLVYLNIGENNNLTSLFKDNLKPVNLYITEDTFNIAEKFPGIDVSKITVTSGANYDNTTGIMTRDSKSSPIIYTYDCGMFKGTKQEIEVTLNTNILEINKENFPDAEFRKWLKNLTIGVDGKFTSDEIAGLTMINIYNNTNIKDLKGIEYFTFLVSLSSSNIGITSLDVSNNKALIYLDCSTTGITSLDVSNNTALTNLFCYNTGITSLDVSNNTALTNLFCSNTSLAYLNIGENINLTDFVKDDLIPINLYITEDSFNIKDKFPGIDVSKITVTSGANYDNTTGIMTRDSKSTPIIYTYDCGTSSNGTKQEISVTLNTYVLEINETNFQDEAFRNHLKGIPEGVDGKFTSDEIAGITNVNVGSNRNINDLAGIEYFTALKSLNCSDTGITSLNVSKNMSLTYLDCFFTEITSLDVSNNTALTYLDCSNTRITKLNVSKNTALIELHCPNTGITSLDVSNNVKLETLFCHTNQNLKTLKVEGAAALAMLRCEDTAITNLDVSKNTALIELYCNGTKIMSLDVSNNKALEWLECSNTGITNLNVSNNKALEWLECYDTKITNLDVSNNEALEWLECYSTKITSLEVGNNKALIYLDCSTTEITSLDVSKNISLSALRCSNTGITSLDVDNNTGLTELFCSNTPLAYLNIGTSNNLIYLLKGSSKPINLNITESTFNIEEKFAGIDVSKISEVENATYIKETGIMSNYKIGTPITYTYDCGTSSRGEEKIEVTLNLIDPRDDSTISITDSLSKTYDGNAVSATPTVNKSGSTGAVSYKWEKKVNDTEWKEMNSLPIDVGIYRVTATLAPDNDYKGIVSLPVEFTISKANNSLTKPLSIKGWTYGKPANEPSAKTTFGSVTYLYSYSKDGIYSRIVPTDAGTWYVKAMVEGTDNYESFESSPVSFVITPMNVLENSQITVPDITADTDIAKLVIKDGDKVLEQGIDYNATKTQDDKKVTVTITFKGNYTGTVTKTYTEEEKVPSGDDKDNDDNKPEEKVDVPTGDNTQIKLLSTISLLSIGCIAFLTGKKRKKN